MFKLVISDDEGKTIIVPLVRDLITIGRQDGNTIRLTERNVSRQHARFVKSEQGGYRVEDLDSYNGVSVNGQRIDKQRGLNDGDRVGIGDYTIAIKADAEAQAQAPTTPRSSAPPGSGAPPARLVMISAPAPGAEFSISKPAVRIGRLEELDLCISHRSISREHARVTQKDGVFEVEDLNSANGVRLNGSGTKKGTLKSGDIVELGQVRFRFVGPGETYVFDPAEEEPTSSHVTASSLGPQRRTVAAIVVTAVVVGGALAFIDDGSPKQADAEVSTVTPEPVVTAAAMPDPEVQRQIDAALEGCRTALAAERFDDAVRSAQNGLALVDKDSALLDCRNKADLALRSQTAYEAGKKALAEDNLDEAYFEFAGLPDGSPYRDSPEVKQVVAKLSASRLADARKVLRSNPSEARRLSEAVVEMQALGVAASAVQEAQKIIAGADRALATQAAPAPTPPQKSTKEPSSNSSESNEASPANVARNCLARGDQRCAVKALEGHADDAQELALLIETYRALSETKKAVKHMETFVQRYPSARQTPQYRQFIAKHEEP